MLPSDTLRTWPQSARTSLSLWSNAGEISTPRPAALDHLSPTWADVWPRSPTWADVGRTWPRSLNIGPRLAHIGQTRPSLAGRRVETTLEIPPGSSARAIEAGSFEGVSRGRHHRKSNCRPTFEPPAPTPQEYLCAGIMRRARDSTKPPPFEIPFYEVRIFGSRCLHISRSAGASLRRCFGVPRPTRLALSPTTSATHQHSSGSTKRRSTLRGPSTGCRPARSKISRTAWRA